MLINVLYILNVIKHRVTISNKSKIKSYSILHNLNHNITFIYEMKIQLILSYRVTDSTYILTYYNMVIRLYPITPKNGLYGRPRVFFTRQRCDLFRKIVNIRNITFVQRVFRLLTFTSRSLTDPCDCVPVACGFRSEPYGGNTMALMISPIHSCLLRFSTYWYIFVADIHWASLRNRHAAIVYLERKNCYESLLMVTMTLRSFTVVLRQLQKRWWGVGKVLRSRSS